VRKVTGDEERQVEDLCDASAGRGDIFVVAAGNQDGRVAEIVIFPPAGG
jgi:hypothetical protein